MVSYFVFKFILCVKRVSILPVHFSLKFFTNLSSKPIEHLAELTLTAKIYIWFELLIKHIENFRIFVRFNLEELQKMISDGL